MVAPSSRRRCWRRARRRWPATCWKKSPARHVEVPALADAWPAAVSVQEGQEIKAGQELALVEAMKMENLLRAERDGKVIKLHAKAGDSLSVDQVIVEFA